MLRVKKGINTGIHGLGKKDMVKITNQSRFEGF